MNGGDVMTRSLLPASPLPKWAERSEWVRLRRRRWLRTGSPKGPSGSMLFLVVSGLAPPPPHYSMEDNYFFPFRFIWTLSLHRG